MENSPLGYGPGQGFLPTPGAGYGGVRYSGPGLGYAGAGLGYTDLGYGAAGLGLTWDDYDGFSPESELLGY